MGEKERLTVCDEVAGDDASAVPEVGPGRPPVQHQFKVGNPGRPKGSRNKLGEAFVAALYADFAAHGAGVIERVRVKEPGAYLRVIARVVPPAVLLKDESELSELSDEELAAYLFAVREALRVREGLDG